MMLTAMKAYCRGQDGTKRLVRLRQLRTLQARWDGERKLWYVCYGLIRGTPLEKRLAELCMLGRNITDMGNSPDYVYAQ